jgi:hypothetical protein
MAMIKCPNCGEMISDKATKCVHCDFVLEVKAKKICKECGAELEDGAKICSNCGCPVEDEPVVEQASAIEPGISTTESKEIPADATIQSSDKNTISTKKKMSKKWVAIILAVVAALVIGLICVQVKKQNEIKAQKEAEAAAEAAEEQYEKNLKDLNFTLLTGTARAESCGNKIHDVWSNTIWEKADADTDQFTKDSATGTFNSDFNTSLKNLFSDEAFKKAEKTVSQDKEDATTLMKSLKNPPEKWNDAYNEIQKFYDDYIKFANLVISPSGNLQSFTQEFNQLDADAVNDYDKMKLYIE